MGRTAVYTKEQVFDAADKLASAGKEVSPNSLRNALGRGSYSTFVKHIDEWQSARKAAPSPVAIDMPDSVKAAFAQCWQSTINEAAREITSIREKADAEISSIKRQLADAIATIDQLEEEANADSAKIESAEAALAVELASARETSTAALAREAALSATVDQMQQQIAAQQTELTRVHAESEAVRNQHAADLARQLAEQAAILKSTQDNAEQAQKFLQQQLADATKNLTEITDRFQQKGEEVATLKFEINALSEKLKEQKVKSIEVIGKLERDKQNMESELMALHKESKAQANKLGRAEGELESLRTQVEGQKDLLKNFSARVNAAPITKKQS